MSHKNTTPTPFLRLVSYLKPHKKEYLLASLYSLLNKIFDIFPEILIGVAVDTVVKKQSSWLSHLGFTSTKSQLLFLGFLTFLIWALESLFQYLYSVKWRNLAQTVQHNLRYNAYAHVQNLDLETFENQSTGNLLSILNDDINQLERFLENGFNQILQVFASSIIIGGVFFFLSPLIGLFTIIPIPLIIWGAFYFQHKLAPKFLNVREKAGIIGTRLANNITGIFTIKSFTAEKYELKQIDKESNAYREANRSAIVWSSLVTPIIRIAILIGFLATLVYGGFLTVEGYIGIGTYSILIFLTQRLLWPLTTLAELTVAYQRTMAAITRVFNLLEIKIHIPEGKISLPQEKTKGKITFDNVSFAYSNGITVIDKISLKINPGETVAFVGTTGSGKTTLMKLLLKFYLPTYGSIKVDEKDISTLKVHDLRKNIGIVSQDVFLFEGTIAENIAYGMNHVPLEKVIEAAKLSEVDTFIQSLPDGYHTKIGERGQKLSGGQRQRLALARAIIKNPPILILDEATSAVDNETEMAIQKSLTHISQGRTTLMIAHRLSTIRNAHCIYVMKHGKIAEKGTHEELIKKNLAYKALWRLQTGQAVNEEVLKDSPIL